MKPNYLHEPNVTMELLFLRSYFPPFQTVANGCAGFQVHRGPFRFVYCCCDTSMWLKQWFCSFPSAWLAEVWRHASCWSFTSACGPSPRSVDMRQIKLGLTGSRNHCQSGHKASEMQECMETIQQASLCLFI